MGLMQQAYDTYCAMEPQYAGIYGKAKEPLVPVSHQIVNAELELTLDADGHLLDARSVEAEQAATIIPVTESSSGRVGDTTCAHPLCDQIRFLSPLYPACTAGSCHPTATPSSLPSSAMWRGGQLLKTWRSGA